MIYGEIKEVIFTFSMNEKKPPENLRLSKGEAIKILIRIRYAKKPQRFEKIIKLINTLDNRNPIPQTLKKKLKKDIPCLILLNHFINPKFYYNTTNELINSKVSFLTTMVSRIQAVCHRSPNTDIFWLFVKNIICYFKDPSQYQLLHKFFTTITKSNDEMKFLLSFTNEDILFTPIEYAQTDFPVPNESRDDYIHFLQLIGIDTTPIDTRFVYKKPIVTKSLKSYFNIREDFADLTALPAVSYSYRDKSFLMEDEKVSNSTPFIDMIANRRYINISTDPITTVSTSQSQNIPDSDDENENDSSSQNQNKGSENPSNSKLNYDLELADYSFRTSDIIHQQEYRMGLLEMSFFELKKHFNISNEAVKNILFKTDFVINFESFKNMTKIKGKGQKQIRFENQKKNESQVTKIFQPVTNDDDSISKFKSFSADSDIKNKTDIDDEKKEHCQINETRNKSLKPFLMRDHWRVYRVLYILYGKEYCLRVERIFRMTYNNNSNNRYANCDIPEKVEKIMKHIFIALIKMKINWYHSQYQAFLDYSFAKPRFIPHPEYCELSIMDIENYNWKSAPEIAHFLSKIIKIIMELYTSMEDQFLLHDTELTSENSNQILMDKYSIDLLTLFSQYYKYFICYYFYPNYILPPLHLLNAAVRWKYIYFSEMKDIMGRSGIEENDDLAKIFYNEPIRRMLSEEGSYIVKRDYKKDTVTPELVVVSFSRENNGCGDSSGDSISIKVSPLNMNNVNGITKKIFWPKSSQNNSPKSHKKSDKTNE